MVNSGVRYFWAVVLLVLGAAPVLAQGDYGFLWWADGWRGKSAEGERVLCVQTNHYGLALDVHRPILLHLGPIDSPKPYAEAVADPNDVIFDLPAGDLSLFVVMDGERYTAVRAAEGVKDRENYPVRLIESGQLVQRFDIQQLVFENESGKPLAVTGRLEVSAWPERVHLTLEVNGIPESAEAEWGISLKGRTVAGGRGPAADSVTLVWEPGREEPHATPMAQVAVVDQRTNLPLSVAYIPQGGWYNVALPASSWSWADEPKRLDRFSVSVTNTGDSRRKIPLNMAVDGAVSGITGMTPLLLDDRGRPTGIPVQVSKNWHRQAGKTFLYEGPWFHGFAQLELDPGDTWTGELVIVYAWWGERPAVSHAQLSLIGWGTNQRWDQVAIGSWGESITYDPDVNLNRSIIDDVRPLMVTGMGEGPWQWTVNVGGGDFLVYVDPTGKRQYLSRMRAAYLEPGPNLTRAVYAGETPDGTMDVRLEVSTPAVDDVNRSFHRFRYDVRKAMPFERMAFYQLGADNYNDHQFATIARGNESGLLEEWKTERGGKKYLRTDIPAAGDVPWFSLHDGVRNEHHPKGAWANRGLVIRSWKARLGGQDIPHPTVAIYGTENGVPSAALELVPPPGVTELLPGDFVEADVELLTVPAEADTYYGPNKAFSEHLEANINTWKPVHRLATANALKVTATKGEVRRRYPVEIAVDANGAAECTLVGGAGYVPVTFTGLATATGFRLEGTRADADDFVQVAYDGVTKTWSRTYTVDMDGVGGAGKTLGLMGE